MKKLLVATAALTLAACSKSPAMPTREGAPDNAVRLAMPEGEALPGVQDGTSQASWAAGADGLSARYGYPGEGPMVSVTCREGVLTVTRHAAAPVGAQALFALVGSDGIMRLPVDATSVPGQRGYVWQGTMSADDSRTKVLGGSYTGTLPGAGMIKVSGGGAVRDLVARCRRSAPTAASEPVAPAATAE
ncbi:hypothetical protein [Novosphingobium taihuense]|uniref:Lipoprotein n=1 Tax=Novosphingobium taihuense TaxID=260085 RepID=A0A7W7ET87_9SPHN|nr:hypothetical protein [Novosphingobium taihuense]MBB4613158.1 hypothetical protein [Novosphingobium taihuense]TWH85299.1 hypothetical protein IQ25_02057 [Novosphingobium taihuense]